MMPFYYLHPCSTEQFISEILEGDNPSNYLVAWLNVVSFSLKDVCGFRL
jgi:hypothetical protein